MKALSRFLRNIDIFQTPIPIYFNNKKAYKTIIGGLLACIMCELCIAFIITLGEKLFNKIDPRVIENLQSLETADNYTLSTQEFVFGMYVLSQYHFNF